MKKDIKTIDQLRKRKHRVRRDIVDCENYFEETFESFMAPVNTVSDAFRGDKRARQEVFASLLTPDMLIKVVTGVVSGIRFVKGLAGNRKKRKLNGKRK